MVSTIYWVITTVKPAILLVSLLFHLGCNTSGAGLVIGSNVGPDHLNEIATAVYTIVVNGF